MIPLLSNGLLFLGGFFFFLYLLQGALAMHIMPLMHRLAVILGINLIVYVFVLYCFHFPCLILQNKHSNIPHIFVFSQPIYMNTK